MLEVTLNMCVQNTFLPSPEPSINAGKTYSMYGNI